MNARQEAQERLGGRYEARVLEPSPPAIREPPWFADDPVAAGTSAAGKPLVSPVGGGDLRWSDLAGTDPELARWCAERWLAAYPRLASVPPNLEPTRRALHRLAEQVISPARREATGKIGLRYTAGGFGTPFFGGDVQIRVEHTELVVQAGELERRAPITTLAAAAEQIGADLLPAGLPVDDEPLTVDDAAARFLGDWFGFAASVLEELRVGAPAASAPSRVQLWPEHFDLAVELGAEDRGGRAAYGLSPGDDTHPAPYAYVAPWVPPPPGDLWRARDFRGAELPYLALLDADDQRATVLEFFHVRLDALGSAGRAVRDDG